MSVIKNIHSPPSPLLRKESCGQNGEGRNSEKYPHSAPPHLKERGLGDEVRLSLKLSKKISTIKLFFGGLNR